jgi:hypothetical protein
VLAAVCVTYISAYATGFTFDLVVMSATDADRDLDPAIMGHARHRRARADGADDHLRLGVQFSDGAKATNVGAFPFSEEKPEGPVLRPRGGGGAPGGWQFGHWVWPLPPAGPLAFVCDWPAASIPLTRHEIDAQLVLAAARRALEIFPPGTPSRPGPTAMAFPQTSSPGTG